MIHSPYDRCIQTPGICDAMNSRGNSEGQGHIQKFIKGVSGVATHLVRSPEACPFWKWGRGVARDLKFGQWCNQKHRNMSAK